MGGRLDFWFLFILLPLVDVLLKILSSAQARAFFPLLNFRVRIDRLIAINALGIGTATSLLHISPMSTLSLDRGDSIPGILFNTFGTILVFSLYARTDKLFAEKALNVLMSSIVKGYYCIYCFTSRGLR